MRRKRKSNRTVASIRVRAAPGNRTRGLMQVAGRVLPCALGRCGIGSIKNEGDGCTPRGRMRLLSAMVRADRIPLRNARLPLMRIEPSDGWCDEAGHRRYNRPVPLPFDASHEVLMRDDHLYDCVLVLDHNVTRHLTVGGSAIFFHLAHADYRPTEGCVAISRAHMLWLWPKLTTRTVMIVE